MFVGVLRLALHVPHARDKKAKRAVVRRLRDRIRARHAVSVAEVGAQETLQRIELGVAVISSDAAVCERELESVAKMCSVDKDAVLLERGTEVVSMGQGPEASWDAGPRGPAEFAVDDEMGG